MHRVPTSIPPSQSATTSACGGCPNLHSDTWPTLSPQIFRARTRGIHSGTRKFGNDTHVWGVARIAWPNYQRHHLPHHPTDPIHDPIVERPHAHAVAQQLPGISKLGCRQNGFGLGLGARGVAKEVRRHSSSPQLVGSSRARVRNVDEDFLWSEVKHGRVVTCRVHDGFATFGAE